MIWEIIAEEHVEERFFMDSVVRGFHVYIWNPEIGKVFICEQDLGTFTIPTLYQLFIHEDNVIVAHVP